MIFRCPLTAPTDTIMYAQYTFTAPVWLYARKGVWYFVTVLQDISDDIGTLFEGLSRGRGSFPSSITSGVTRWQTSIFPDKASATFLLLLKAQILKRKRLTKAIPSRYYSS
jgi:hypothetical protein